MTVKIAMQRQSTGMATTLVRPTLPDRNVTSPTIEDAFVRFVLYCNPAVPLETDTTALREAFRTPPKSGGKSFSTFTLFELIKQFDTKSIKTWAELALKLGVEPPDQDKGQSSQKIQQYAVRLKRWMHSMHVDAFFEYLLDNPHPYWTEVPQNPNPINELGRDGVAAEDDMALRALLPQIRPRRVRRKADDDSLNKSPSQRPRVNSPPNPDEYSALPSALPSGLPSGLPADMMEAWTAHPDGRFHFPDPVSAMGMGQGQGSNQQWPHLDTLSGYPQSAITPSTRHTFWNDEPRSAISKPKSLHRRHGAKVVSSAWRSTGVGDIRKKRRGRPPLNPLNDGSLSAIPGESSSYKSATPENDGISQTPARATMTPVPKSATSVAARIPTTLSTPRAMSNMNASMPIPNPRPPQGTRPAKPGRLSLQVPERVGGSVRLATPPMVMVNGQTAARNAASTINLSQGPGAGVTFQPQNAASFVTDGVFALDMGGIPDGFPPEQQQPPPTQYSELDYDEGEDRTNMDELIAFFTHEVLTAHWLDATGSAIPPCGLDEAQAIVKTIISDQLKGAPNRGGFLTSVAALAGMKLLMTTNKMRCTRLEEGDGYSKYQCNWELRLGPIRSTYSMQQTVSHATWKKAASMDREAEADDEESNGDGGGDASARHWQKRYQGLLASLQEKDKQLSDMKRSVLDSLKDDRGGRGSIP